MSSRSFALSQAGADFVTILPDLSTLPNVGDILSAGTLASGAVKTKFNPPGGTGVFLPLTGGILTGPLEIDTTNPEGGLNASFITLSSAHGSINTLDGKIDGLPRWLMFLGDGADETGADAGSNFSLRYYDDTGGVQNTAFTVYRATGVINFNQTPTINGVRMAFLPLAGGTLTGPLVINDTADPFVINCNNNFSVDPFGNVNAVSLNGGGGRLTGPLTVSASTGAPLVLTKNLVTPVVPPNSAMLAIQGADNAANSITMYAFGATSGFNCSLSLRRTFGTAAAPAAVTVNTVLGALLGAGYDGTTYGSAAVINFIADDNFSSTSRAGRFMFQACPVGSTALATVMSLTNAGHLLLNGNQITSGYKLDMSGGVARIDAGAGGALPAPATSDSLTLAGPDGASTRMRVFASGITGTNPTVAGFRSAGTRAAPTNVAIGDIMLAIGGYGYGATGFSTNARAAINFRSAEPWTDTAQGAYFGFVTTAIGSTTTVQAMQVSPNGNLLIGTTTDGTIKLDVVGAARFNGNLGFFNATPVARATITGSRGSATVAVLTALLAALGAATGMGLITDSTTA